MDDLDLRILCIQEQNQFLNHVEQHKWENMNEKALKTVLLLCNLRKATFPL